jgi:DNA primase
LYGIDQARQAATKAGYLAVVEGYTDVLMAHQHGVHQVVATMGTALNARHVRHLRNLVPRVVLVFDADQGGDKGVDRALEVFVSQELDLRVAALPEGLDPCDLLAEQGSEPFTKALEQAQDVFEYKLERLWEKEVGLGVDGQRRVAEQMLAILAKSSPGRSLKLELMVNRIAHRLQVKEETLWTRLRQMRSAQSGPDRTPPRSSPVTAPEEQERSAKAARHEVELLEVLLADAALLPRVAHELTAGEIEHPGLRQLLEGLLGLLADGLPVDLDQLRGRLDNDRLLAKAMELQDSGLGHADRTATLEGVLARFREKRLGRRNRELKHQAVDAGDHESAVAVLRQLQNHGPGGQQT